jgi:hypothetical protein
LACDIDKKLDIRTFDVGGAFDIGGGKVPDNAASRAAISEHGPTARAINHCSQDSPMVKVRQTDN